VTGARDEHHVKVAGADQSIEMRPDERLPGIGTPVSEQAMLDVLERERPLEERIAAQVKHPGAQVQGGAPVAVESVEFPLVQRGSLV
jgi:hypothetical protein